MTELELLRGLVAALEPIHGPAAEMRWARRAPAADGQGYDVVDVEAHGAMWVVWHGWAARETGPQRAEDRLTGRWETREEAIAAAIAWLEGR